MGTRARVGLAVAFAVGMAGTALGNVGPFVLKYPEGDPAAQGVLARLDPDLKPGRESRLKVLEETLEIGFWNGRRGIVFLSPDGNYDDQPNPLVCVSVTYRIENPTDQLLTVEFGFPILRGITSNLHDFSIGQSGSGESHSSPTYLRISYSSIYGMIRQRGRAVIERGIEADKRLAELVAAVQKSSGTDEANARKALEAHLRGPLKWNERDAALMAEYARLGLRNPSRAAVDPEHPSDYELKDPDEKALHDLRVGNLGPLSAIGEQRATQLFAQLASRFDPAAASSYEAIFSAWGGDIRERSVDLQTGAVRPREVVLDRTKLSPRAARRLAASDPTVYARVDYLDPQAGVTEAEKASCQAILRNLPVVFTFAPMNLMHYRLSFDPKSTCTVTMRYWQHAYLDTREPRTYQIAYVVHPARFWDSFGPIHVQVATPVGVDCRASVPLKASRFERLSSYDDTGHAIRRTTLDANPPGELLFAVDADAWDAWAANPAAWRKTHPAPGWVSQLGPLPISLAGAAFVVVAGLVVIRVSRKRGARARLAASATANPQGSQARPGAALSARGV